MVKILPQPDYSDHCKIVLTIKNIKDLTNASSENSYNWKRAPLGFSWSNVKQKFLSCLFQSELIKKEIEKCNQYLAAELVESAGNSLQKIYLKPWQTYN